MCGLPILGLLVTNYFYFHASEMGGSGEGVVLALNILPSSSLKKDKLPAECIYVSKVFIFSTHLN